MMRRYSLSSCDLTASVPLPVAEARNIVSGANFFIVSLLLVMRLGLARCVPILSTFPRPPQRTAVVRWLLYQRTHNHAKLHKQARLDPDSQKALERLSGRLGWSPSGIVREGIRLLESCYGQRTGQRIVGLGKFSSGIPDLGSSVRHLKDFGR